jgi:methylenetetrahydrofolate reductase (NADPH)
MYNKEFNITIEVVPPAGPDPEKLLKTLDSLSGLAFDGFSVASNPVAKPNMNALAMCSILKSRFKKDAILHCTTRDHNRIYSQGLLWGAKALGINTVIIMTGDLVAFKNRGHTTTSRDLNVMELVEIAREADLHTGVVIEPVNDAKKMALLVKRLEKKVVAGAQFVVTQPVYDEESARLLSDLTKGLNIPVILGILPLRTFRHAEFLHNKVSGIYVPDHVRKRIEKATDSVEEGNANAREMLAVAKSLFNGACIMPPFEHFEVMSDILK